MKILHLISSLGFYGAERVVLSLASQSQAQGHDVFVGALRNDHNPHQELIDAAGGQGLLTRVFESRGRFDFGTVRAVRHFLRESRIDILHTHNYKSDLIGFCASRFMKTSWVATNHVWHGTTTALKFYEALDAFFLRFADRVIAVSYEIAGDLLTRGISHEKVRTIFNGIDISGFSPGNYVNRLRPEWGINPEDFVIGIIGRLSPEKGHEIFLKAAAMVADQNPGVKFLIVGEGPLRKDLEEKTHQMSLNGKVVFTGNQSDMRQVYSMIDILVNSSLIEGLPMTILEAMAAKVPVVASWVGGIPTIVQDGETGLLVLPRDVGALRDKIFSLIHNGTLRQSLAEKAFALVTKSYSLERMAAQYHKVYDEVAL